MLGLCDKLGKTPDEISEMSIDDINWLLAFYTYQNKEKSKSELMQRSQSLAGRGIR